MRSMTAHDVKRSAGIPPRPSDASPRRNVAFLRSELMAGWDALAWLIAAPLAVLLHFWGNAPVGMAQLAFALGIGCAAAQVALGFSIKFYRGRYRSGSFDESLSVIAMTFVVALAGGLVAASQGPMLPRPIPLIAGGFAVGIMLGGRFVLRGFRQRFRQNKGGLRTLIYGAGDIGIQLLTLMVANPDSPFTPVGFLDDDPGKRHLHITGKQVLGTSVDLERVVRKTGTQTLVVAIAHVDSASLFELDRRCTALGISLCVIPSTSEIINGAVNLGDLSYVTDEDLLGRRPIDIDEAGIDEMLAGKRVLITGAGGSIGSELARQVHRYNPAFLGLLDRDESAIHAVQLSIDGRGLLDSDNLILADIRDAAWILEIMETVRPDIIFHAAALKHLSLLERYPEEAHKTNVLGTKNVLDAAQAVGVQVFVNISTDKAANPNCVLGHTKLMTERMVASIEPVAGERYMSVRFGNVLGSRGSVLIAFHYQIEKGGPVTVTDPDVTRYFMTIPEAVHLVLQATVIGAHAETMILDMGQPVRIADVARQMIEKSGRDIEIVYTGLRPGEKISEALFGSYEVVEHGQHALISHTRVAALS